MRYSYEFKRKAVELYRKGKWIEPKAGYDYQKEQEKVNEMI